MSKRALALLTALGLVVSWARPGHAQVVRQLTDERTTVASPGALDDAGSVLFAGASADLAGENPDHAFQILRFDPDTGVATPVTGFPGGTAALVSVSDDGQWLAFPSPADLTGGNHDESLELFAMSSEGTTLVQLTHDPAPNAGSVAQAVISGDGARIAFTANTDPLGQNPDHRDQLFVIGRDGHGLAQLTAVVAGSFGAIAISDDGSRVAFGHDGDLIGANPDLGGEIFVVEADGSGLRQLSDSPDGFASSSPSLSGNGSRIAFQSDADLLGGNPSHQTEVFVIDWDGSALRQLTSTSAVIGITGDPTAQSPSITDDGGTVVYHSNQSSLFPPVNIDGNFEIFRIGADGTGRTQLTSTVLDGGSLLPVVAGNGGRIAYYGAGVDLTLQTMDGDGGSRLELLSFDPVFHSQPEISPDGSRAVFVRAAGLFGGGQIWRIEADGTERTQVTSLGSGSPASPSIAADNRTIVFSADSDPDGLSNLDGSAEVFLVHADGSGLRQLTDGPADTSSANPTVAASADVVVFDSNADLTGGNPDLSREVFRVGPDGSGLTQLTDGVADTVSRLPRIDASGVWVVFESNADLDGGNADGSFEIHRVPAGGGLVERLTGHPLLDSRMPDISAAGDRIVFDTGADFLGTNPEGNVEVFLYRADGAVLEQVTSFAEGDSSGARISGDGEWVYFSSDAPVFEDDPDRPEDLYRASVSTGDLERVGALRAGLVGGLGLLGGGSGVPAVDDSGEIGVHTGIGDFTEANPDLLPELWIIDREAAPTIRVGRDAPTPVSWTHESGPLRYDVVRGDVASLAEGASGTVDLGPVLCLEDDSPDANTVGFEDAEQPGPGQVFFYLYRGSQGLDDGPGSYGHGSGGGERRATGGDCAS